LDSSGASIFDLTERYAAVDAAKFNSHLPQGGDIDPIYTLRDQLFVEPQPATLPTQYKLDASIRMSKAEVAVAQSHINVWRKIAAGSHPYVLILEDDVWFHSNFSRNLDQAWNEVITDFDGTGAFDVLYVSYLEVKHGAPKVYETENVFRPERGLWHLSGYILSREGAAKLLQMLPCRGPIDLWINHHFKQLTVLATKKSLVEQRYDGGSTNSYSILPSLTAIGAINSEGPALFNVQPKTQPVFAFGPDGSGLSSLAIALSMLGYRCCSDIQRLPDLELKQLLEGNPNRIFDAYVNVGSLDAVASQLVKQYPNAKFIITSSKVLKQKEHPDFYEFLSGADVAYIEPTNANPWQAICEHLRCAPPICSYPLLQDIGQRSALEPCIGTDNLPEYKRLKWDKSPWVVEPDKLWNGIRSVPNMRENLSVGTPISLDDRLKCINQERWVLRDDTFTDNLALFRPANVQLNPRGGVVLHVKKELLGVRDFSAAAISSQDEYKFGRFEAVIRASNSPGIVTGMFLHRNSPRQEIDIEIAGNRPDRLLVNVFYNPGGSGANFDYGFRGAPSTIDLEFDASRDEHRYAIEWDPCEIRWFVDDELVHRRTMWNPTPIPNLPMTFHINNWPTRSTELAGRVRDRLLPASATVTSISVSANCVKPS